MPHVGHHDKQFRPTCKTIKRLHRCVRSHTVPRILQDRLSHDMQTLCPMCGILQDIILARPVVLWHARPLIPCMISCKISTCKTGHSATCPYSTHGILHNINLQDWSSYSMQGTLSHMQHLARHSIQSFSRSLVPHELCLVMRC